jgi:tRNA(Ile)-lysidine synthase
VLEVTPGVWQGDRLVAAPVAGWPQGWQATFLRPFAAAISAH